jgi:uncharacterized membrane protein YqjE
MNAFEQRLVLIEQRRQMMQMLAMCGVGVIMAGFGLIAFAVDHGHNRLLLGWVVLGVTLGFVCQLRFLSQIMRRKDKGTA